MDYKPNLLSLMRDSPVINAINDCPRHHGIVSPVINAINDYSVHCGIVYKHILMTAVSVWLLVVI